MVIIVNYTVFGNRNFLREYISLSCSQHTHTHTVCGDGQVNLTAVIISLCIYQNTMLYTPNIYNFYLKENTVATFGKQTQFKIG